MNEKETGRTDAIKAERNKVRNAKNTANALRLFMS
jgi:hypothetical protein